MIKSRAVPAAASPPPVPPPPPASPLRGSLHLADQPAGPHDLPPDEEQAAVLMAEVGVERLGDGGVK